MRPDTDCYACLMCQLGADSHSRLMQKLTDQGYPALLYAITNRRYLLQNKVDPHSDILEKNLVWHARYRSKYTNYKTVDQRKSKFKNKKTLSCKCDQFYVDNFSLPGSLATTFFTCPRQVCRFSFVACPDFNGWFIWLLMTSVIFFTLSASFAACLLMSSSCLVSSRSKCVIAFVCSDTALRTLKARHFVSVAAGCCLMPVKSLVLASRLYVFSNVLSLQTPLD